jgi:plasmid stabilization system protein ParE
MPQGDKSKYTDKQERKADPIAESYENRGVQEKEAERRACATVNKDDGGGKEPGGSGRGRGEPAIPPRTEEAESAAQLPPQGPQPADPRPPKRPQPHASETPGASRREISRKE